MLNRPWILFEYFKEKQKTYAFFYWCIVFGILHIMCVCVYVCAGPMSASSVSGQISIAWCLSEEYRLHRHAEIMEMYGKIVKHFDEKTHTWQDLTSIVTQHTISTSTSGSLHRSPLMCPASSHQRPDRTPLSRATLMRENNCFSTNICGWVEAQCISQHCINSLYLDCMPCFLLYRAKHNICI